MINIYITVRNKKKGLSAVDEDELMENIADFMGVGYEDIELDWEFADDEGEEE